MSYETVIGVFARVLAAGESSPSPSPSATPLPEIDPDRVTPGVWGFLSLLFLVLVAVALYFSLRKQLGRVDFDENSPLAGGDEDKVDLRDGSSTDRPGGGSTPST